MRFTPWRFRWTSWRTRERGQSLVEFALVLPFLLIFVFGGIEMSLILKDYLSLNESAIAGARYGGQLLGDPSADLLIATQVLRAAGTLDATRLRFVGATGTRYGPYALRASDGRLLSGGNIVSGFGENLFFRRDPGNGVLAASASTDWRTNRVSVQVTYDHDIVLPGANLFATTNGAFPMASTRVYPVAGYAAASGQTRNLSGLFPVGLLDTQYFAGQALTLTNRTGTQPGSFQWLDLEPSNNGAKTQQVADEINGVRNPTAAIPGNINVATGNFGNSAQVIAAIDAHIGDHVAIPIWDTTQGNGANATFHCIGLIEVILTGWNHGQGTATGTYVGRLM